MKDHLSMRVHLPQYAQTTNPRGSWKRCRPPVHQGPSLRLTTELLLSLPVPTDLCCTLPHTISDCPVYVTGATMTSLHTSRIHSRDHHAAADVGKWSLPLTHSLGNPKLLHGKRSFQEINLEMHWECWGKNRLGLREGGGGGGGEHGRTLQRENVRV